MATPVDDITQASFLVRLPADELRALDRVKRKGESRNGVVRRLIREEVISSRANAADRAASMFDD